MLGVTSVIPSLCISLLPFQFSLCWEQNCPLLVVEFPVTVLSCHTELSLSDISEAPSTGSGSSAFPQLQKGEKVGDSHPQQQEKIEF